MKINFFHRETENKNYQLPFEVKHIGANLRNHTFRKQHSIVDPLTA